MEAEDLILPAERDDQKLLAIERCEAFAEGVVDYTAGGDSSRRPVSGAALADDLELEHRSVLAFEHDGGDGLGVVARADVNPHADVASSESHREGGAVGVDLAAGGK